MYSVTSSSAFGVGGAWLAEYTLEAAGAGVVVFDADARIARCNSVAMSLLGGRAGGVDREVEARFVGRRLTDEPFVAVDRDDRAIEPGSCPVGRVLRTGSKLTDEVGIRDGDGAQRRLSVTALPIHGPGGSIRAVITSVRDVTAEHAIRRESIASAIQNRLSFEHSLVGQLIVDRRGHLIDWNASMLSMVGRADVELMDADLDAVCDIDAAWLWDALVTGGEEQVDGFTWLVRADGSEVPVRGRFRLAHATAHGSVVVAQFSPHTPFASATVPSATVARPAVGRRSARRRDCGRNRPPAS